MMGVAEPDLPASSSDDNINLGDKDSIRRRALWALEGKPDISYSKVEIPEFASPEVEKKTFDFRMSFALLSLTKKTHLSSFYSSNPTLLSPLGIWCWFRRKSERSFG